MHRTTSRIISCFLLIVILISCKQSSSTGNNTSNINQIDSLVSTGQKYANSNLDSLIYTAKKLTNVAIITGNKKALVYGELFTSQYYWLVADHKTAMQIAIKCLANAQKWKIYNAYPIIYGIMGNVHKENSNYQLAFDDSEKGLRWAKANKDTNEIITMLSLKAMFIHTRAEALHIALNDTSINVQLTALKLARSKPQYDQLEVALDDNIAQYYFDNGDFKKAINYGEQGTNLALKYNRQRALTYSYTWLGMAWYQLGNKQKGIDYLNRALKIARDLKQPYREMEIYQTLYHFYYKTGDYKTAIDQNTRAQQMHDSLRVNMNARQVSELQIKYESSQKDIEIAHMNSAKKKQNKQIFFISILSLLFIVFFFILFLQYRIIWHHNSRIKKSNEKKDKALIDIAFIQSHEIRKPLASILGLINVIRESGGIVDQECLNKLEDAGKDLDQKIHSIISHIDEVNNNNE